MQELVHRCGRRVWGRAGRAVKPHGRRKYRFPLPWGEMTPLDRVKVHVTRASFFEGKDTPKPPVKIVKTATVSVRDDGTARKVKRSTVTLKNLLPHAVDAILRGEPKGGGPTCLFHVSLEPGESRTLGEPGERPADRFRPRAFQAFRGRYEELRVVDWSVLVDATDEPARDLLEPAWRNLYRWPIVKETIVTGKVRFQVEFAAERAPLGGLASFRLEGGRSRLEADVKITPALRSRLFQDIGSVVASFRRPTFEALLRRANLRFLDLTSDGTATIHVRSRDPRARILPLPVLHVRDGRIVGAEGASLEMHEEARYTHVSTPDGRLVLHSVQRDLVNFPKGITPLERRRQDIRQQDILTLPAQVRRESFDMLSGRRTALTTLAFEEISFEGPLEKGTPTGSGAAALFAAWNAPYRYPAGAWDLSGSFLVLAPETAENWVGREKIRGSAFIEGWRGRVSSGDRRPYERLRLVPRGKISKSGKRQIADLFRARLSIWTRQDFCARRSFEEEFRGCTIETGDAPGTLEVEGHERIAAVKVIDGLPVLVRNRDGTRQWRRFARVKGLLVPVETRWISADREARTEVTFKLLGPGLLFPQRIRVRDWFHAGWGPETWELKVKRKRR